MMPDTSANPADGTKSAAAPLTALPPTKLGLALRTALSQTWDHFGVVIGISLTGTALVTLLLNLFAHLPDSLLLPIRLLILAIVGACSVAFPLGGAFGCALRIASNEEVSYSFFLRECVRLYGMSARLLLLQTLALFLFAANFWFYRRIWGVGGLLAEVVCGYLLLFWSMLSALHFPLSVAQESGVFDEPTQRARRGTFAALRRALYLTFASPLHTLGTLAALVLLTVLMTMLALPLALFWLGAIPLVATQCVRQLLIRYGVVTVAVAEGAVPDADFRLPKL